VAISFSLPQTRRSNFASSYLPFTAAQLQQPATAQIVILVRNQVNSGRWANA